jgi:hypothetical protein
MKIEISRIDVSGGVESISVITVINHSPVVGTAKIEIRRIGIEPSIIQLTARGLPGPSGGGSGNSYFPSGWN